MIIWLKGVRSIQKKRFPRAQPRKQLTHFSIRAPPQHRRFCACHAIQHQKWDRWNVTSLGRSSASSAFSNGRKAPLSLALLITTIAIEAEGETDTDNEKNPIGGVVAVPVAAGAKRWAEKAAPFCGQVEESGAVINWSLCNVARWILIKLRSWVVIPALVAGACQGYNWWYVLCVFSKKNTWKCTAINQCKLSIFQVCFDTD